MPSCPHVLSLKSNTLPHTVLTSTTIHKENGARKSQHRGRRKHFFIVSFSLGTTKLLSFLKKYNNQNLLSNITCQCIISANISTNFSFNGFWLCPDHMNQLLKTMSTTAAGSKGRLFLGGGGGGGERQADCFKRERENVPV